MVEKACSGLECLQWFVRLVWRNGGLHSWSLLVGLKVHTNVGPSRVISLLLEGGAREIIILVVSIASLHATTQEEEVADPNVDFSLMSTCKHMIKVNTPLSPLLQTTSSSDYLLLLPSIQPPPSNHHHPTITIQSYHPTTTIKPSHPNVPYNHHSTNIQTPPFNHHPTTTIQQPPTTTTNRSIVRPPVTCSPA